MAVIRKTKSDITQKKLWPVVLLLVVAGLLFRNSKDEGLGANLIHLSTLEQEQQQQHQQDQPISITEDSPPSRLLSPSSSIKSSENELKIPHNDNRSIALIHVGKAGGMTVNEAMALSCWPHSRNFKYTPNCMEERFLNLNNKLGTQTKTFFHMGGGTFKNEHSAIDGSYITSFLFPLRNPFDRLVSGWNFNHPMTCPSKAGAHGSCGIARSFQQNTSHPVIDLAYKTCFPTLDFEVFAQSVMSPWDTSPLTNQLPLECFRLARDVLQGRRPPGRAVSEHFFLNYEHYHKNSVQKYPDKEVFGIRVDHSWEDLIALDKLLGGSGKFSNEGHAQFHGKKAPGKKAPLTAEATKKLCCGMWRDIHVYRELWERTLNFNATTKKDQDDTLRQQCGVAGSWEEWTEQCKAHLEQDAKVLDGLEIYKEGWPLPSP